MAKYNKIRPYFNIGPMKLPNRHTPLEPTLNTIKLLIVCYIWHKSVADVNLFTTFIILFDESRIQAKLQLSPLNILSL